MTTVSSQDSVPDFTRQTGVPDFGRFAIGFDPRDRARFHALIDEVIDSGRWSEGDMVARLEAAWELHNGVAAVAMSSWAGGALAALHFAGVKGETVLCPSNTFMATPLAVVNAGASVEFVDCNREDLCMSFKDFEAKADKHKPKAAFLVHIGGHLAFEVEEIAHYCSENGIFLIEDCAHAHGAEWNGRKPGTYGDAGVYSLYATKTITTGEGGVLVSNRPEVLEHARAFRNYGKPSYEVHGPQLPDERVHRRPRPHRDRATARDRGVEERRSPSKHLDPVNPSRLELPGGMVSGYYKYIVFEWLERSTGRVYDEPCHRIMGHHVKLPNSDWVARNHSCVPLYYRPESE